jgi:hypothetical protein
MNAPTRPKIAPEAPTATVGSGEKANDAAPAKIPVVRKTALISSRPSSRSIVVPKIHST